MKNILIILVLILLSSCATQKRCNQKYPPSGDTIRIELVRDSIVYKDTTITVHLPGEVVVDSVPIPCPPPPPSYQPKKIHVQTDFAEAWAWWEYPSIKIKLVQKDTTLQLRLDNAIKESYHWKSLYEKLHIVSPPEKYIPDIYKFSLWMWIFVIVAFVGYILIKVFKIIKI